MGRMLWAKRGKKGDEAGAGPEHVLENWKPIIAIVRLPAHYNQLGYPTKPEPRVGSNKHFINQHTRAP